MRSINAPKYPNNLQDVRKQEFARLKDSLYLDHAGSTLYSSQQIQQVFEDMQYSLYGNPHSANPSSDLTTATIHQVRCSVLSHFNATFDDYDVIFCSGTTHALKMVGHYFAFSKGSIFAYLEDNHTSIVGIREIASEKNADCFCLSLPKKAEESNSMTCLSNYKPQQVKKSPPKNSFKEGSSSACLFAYPLQSNFSGYRYPTAWIQKVQENGVEQLPDEGPRDWLVLIDAASYVTTSPLDLKRHPADFVCLSFYKMFGFPTGLGALLVRKGTEKFLLGKKYFGGGTADGYLATEDYFKPRKVLHERLEDGTLPFLDIVALKYGFDTVYRICGSMRAVRDHAFSTVRRLHCKLSELSHQNGVKAIRIYSHASAFESHASQGPVLAFNVMREDGSYVGFNHVLHLAASRNVHLRAGCFCNVGACRWHLDIDAEELKRVYESGHVCGDAVDLVEGYPVGALRASFGYMSTNDDVDGLVSFLEECFVEPSSSKDVFYDAISDLSSFKRPRKNLKLKKITLYPVKSCRGMMVNEWELCKTGLKYDRNWMVVNQHGICLTLKRYTSLALIQPFVDLEKSTLRLSADGFGSVVVDLHGNTDDQAESRKFVAKSDVCQTKVCGDRVIGSYCGDEVAEWLTKVIGEPVSLLRKAPENDRYIGKSIVYGLAKNSALNQQGDDAQLSLSNVAQYLLLSQSSLDFLRDSMPDVADLDTDAMLLRFRGNLLVSGGEAFDEESWCEVEVDTTAGDGTPASFVCCGCCNRCSMVCIDHVTGKRSVEPLRTLGNLPPSEFVEKRVSKLPSQRRNHFGVYLSSFTFSSCIRVGADVRVKRKPS